MITVSPTSLPQRTPALLSWRRIRTALLAAVVPALLLSINSNTSILIWLLRAAIVALGALLAFGIAERWPARLPQRLPRWVFQLLAIALAAPLGALLAYLVTTGFNPDFADEPRRLQGFAMLTFFCMLIGPWLALTAMLRQREAFAREQALAFELERSELARQATDARLRLLTAQVQPHFLFNTLANVQALVDTGSPQASRVLGSLIAYLRAAVPRLDARDSSIAREVDLVRAYLDLMQMRMPDRLQYSISVDPDAMSLACPPTTLLTLVENAVRHGIDPAEAGGRIDVVVQLWADRCRLRVCDSGVGLSQGATADGRPASLGTGLNTLSERLQLAFDDQAQVRLSARGERGELGVEAEVEFPARRVAA
ncbi:MAG: histidine kinase [Burkholderiaceae bacterium]|jgi:hypothetical protein|nr:histidine kinase [Burkholderiaceae bacterium]